MTDGLIRIACATPALRVADPAHNAVQIVAQATQAADNDAQIVLFPELCVTASTCGDLFFQSLLLDAAEDALQTIMRETAGLDLLLIVGIPLRCQNGLYNAAAVISHGNLLGIVPKTLPDSNGGPWETRYFKPGTDGMQAILHGVAVPTGADLLFTCRDMPSLCVGIEIGGELYAAQPPSVRLALHGATVLLNPAASAEAVGRADFRRMQVMSQSARLAAVYARAEAGKGESTTDMVFSGHRLIAENGMLVGESQRFTEGLTLADVDVESITAERLHRPDFSAQSTPLRAVPFSLCKRPLTLIRPVSPTPFVPQDPAVLAARCEDVLTTQATGLAARLAHSGIQCPLVALSGGLDSTLALIVIARAMDMLRLPREKILVVTMPGFGTTDRTKRNAYALAEAYCVTLREIPIKAAVLQHFKDLGHDPDQTDLLYENAQARERTQVLMDLAHQVNGLAVGTGSLSELALGWATYNGDHMSMYGVNAGVPKTLVRHLVMHEADRADAKLAYVLHDVLATPVSPELLPPKDGGIAQRTEDLVGPYLLHDFFIYYTLRHGFRPRKVFRLAIAAFGRDSEGKNEGQFEADVIKRWLCVFIRRFFSQQFKRSCLPDGPMVGSVSLSPRTGLHMPSDAKADAWLKEAENL